jgi:hypothetical protein
MIFGLQERSWDFPIVRWKTALENRPITDLASLVKNPRHRTERFVVYGNTGSRGSAGVKHHCSRSGFEWVTIALFTSSVQERGWMD